MGLTTWKNLRDPRDPGRGQKGMSWHAALLGGMNPGSVMQAPVYPGVYVESLPVSCVHSAARALHTSVRMDVREGYVWWHLRSSEPVQSCVSPMRKIL